MMMMMMMMIIIIIVIIIITFLMLKILAPVSKVFLSTCFTENIPSSS